MTIHLQRQIDRLKQRILELGDLVERAVEQAIEAVEKADVDQAEQLIERDAEIDQMEIDVEEECLHTLALHQPVAFDLRYVVAVLKINNDLERIADLAVNIAEQAKFLANEPPLDTLPYDLPKMTLLVRGMVNDSLKALVDVDTVLAQQVRDTDDQVDHIHRHMYEQIRHAIQTRMEHMPQLIHMMNISRNLERIADLAVNIAEDVLYMAEGQIFRHHGGTQSSST